MVWSLDLDDFNGKSCNMGKYPLLTVLNGVLNGHTYTKRAITKQATRWAGRGANCMVNGLNCVEARVIRIEQVRLRIHNDCS